MNQPSHHSIDWSQPGHVLKVSGGRVLYTECHPNGSITERDVFDWNQTWSGNWKCSEGRLTISVGSYILQTEPHSNRAFETNRDDPRHSRIPFLLLPVILRREKQQLGTGNEALVKFIQGHRVFVSELRHGGVVREYPLVIGTDPEAWYGAWSHQGNKLSINVGIYSWVGVIDQQSSLVRGTEAVGNQRYDLNGVLVRMSSLALKRSGRENNGRLLFEYRGYRFFRPEKIQVGYFSNVIEARRPGLGGQEHTFAAKCIDMRHNDAARRESQIATRVSGTDGLIAHFESFELPQSSEFSSYAGNVVQILEWGDTDLSRYSRARGPMKEADVLTVARDIGLALDSLHTKFQLIHSDVKLANIIGRRTGDAMSWKLVDFNVATALDRDGRARRISGTPICMSPNLQHDSRYTLPADDIWALGVVLTQLALGESWNGDEPVTADAILRKRRRLPKGLREFIKPIVAEDPRQRCSARDLRLAADQALNRIHDH